MKRCTKCGIEKEEGEFYMARDGYFRGKCRECVNAAQKEWRQTNPERSREIQAASYKKHNERRKAYEKKRRMLPEVKEGVKRSLERRRFSQALSASRKDAKRKRYCPCTASELEIKTAFTGFCHVCRIPEIECNTKLHLDHNHETGEFRGWLCRGCNTSLGMLKESPIIIKKLAEYIDKEGLCVDCNQEDGFEFFN